MNIPRSMARFLARITPVLVTLALCLVGRSAFAAGEVKLLRGSSIVSYGEGLTAQQTEYDILVKNIAFQKNVAIHLRAPDGTWGDLAAHYVEPAANGYELWRAERVYKNSSTPPEAPRDLEFVVRYDVLGVTYWDNNGGANYKVGSQSGPLLAGGAAVLASQAYAYDATRGGGFYGLVDVANLAYTKRVRVHYSTDDFRTESVVDATYTSQVITGDGSYWTSPNAYGVEAWSFTVANLNATRVKFWIEYDVNGQTYRDDNFGADYTATPNGSDGAAATIAQ